MTLTEDDAVLQKVIDETAAARGWPHTTWGMRSMLASVGLTIVRSGEIKRLRNVLEELAVGFESASERCTYSAEAQRLDNCAKLCRAALSEESRGGKL